MQVIITSYRPCITSPRRAAGSVRVTAMATPKISAKTMTPIMSPLAAALTGLSGTMATISSTPRGRRPRRRRAATVSPSARSVLAPGPTPG